MEKTYYLDLVTLVDSLSQQSATLRTTLPKGVPGISEACTALVRVQNGKVIECVIEGKRGVRMDGTKAFQLLRTVEVWQVQLEAGQTNVPARVEHSGPASWQTIAPSRFDGIPRQRMPFNPAFVRDVSARERMVLHMVLTMVNGQRSIGQIKEQLRLPAETVDWALDYLRHIQVIE